MQGLLSGIRWGLLWDPLSHSPLSTSIVSRFPPTEDEPALQGGSLKHSSSTLDCAIKHRVHRQEGLTDRSARAAY